MSLPGLSCKPSCPWMGGIPCATGRESGGQAGVIPSHCEWRCIHDGVSGNSCQARSCGCCVFAGVVGCVVLLTHLAASWGVPVTGVSSRATEPCREP